MKDRTKPRTAVKPARPTLSAPARPAPSRPGMPGRVGGRFGALTETTGRNLRDLRSELKKVVWPTREQAINLTFIVLAVSVAMGVLLGGVDYLFKALFEFLVANL